MGEATSARPEDRVERLLDDLDVDTARVRDPAELRAVHAAAEEQRAGEQRLRDAVAVARAAGYSWGAVGAALGVTAQAAHQRFRAVA